MYLSIPATKLWEELKENRLAKYGAVTAVTAISKLRNVISSQSNFWWAETTFQSVMNYIFFHMHCRI